MNESALALSLAALAFVMTVIWAVHSCESCGTTAWARSSAWRNPASTP